MLVKYNALNRLEKPELFLCNPGTVCDANGYVSGNLGALIATDGVGLTINFNAVSELSFRVYQTVLDDETKNEIVQRTFLAVQNRRLIFIDDIGFFTITDVKDNTGDGIRYKDVTAESVDAELKQRIIPYIADGTYRFVTDENESESSDNEEPSAGILDAIVSTLPLWSVGHVDEDVASRYRSFEDVGTDKNCLSFMIEDLQDAYECIFIFDTLHRVINVYDQEAYASSSDRNTGIHLTHDDVVKSCSISENSDDLYTAMRAVGGSDEDVVISLVNPTGDNVIYNFDYYLSWMSSGLRTKLERWKAAVQTEIDSTSSNSYRNLRNAQSEKNDALDENTHEKNRQLSLRNQYAKCLSNIAASEAADGEYAYTVPYTNDALHELGVEDEDLLDISAEIDELKDEIEGRIDDIDAEIADIDSAITTLEGELATLEDDINTIIARLHLGSADAPDDQSTGYRLTADEKAELNFYIYEGIYKDDYVLFTDDMTNQERFEQMKTLYDRADKQLSRVSYPRTEIKIDVDSFIFADKFKKHAEELTTGCLITADLTPDAAGPETLFVSGINVDYDERSMDLTLSNSFSKYDPKTLFEDVLGSVSKSANTIDYVKELLAPVKNGEIDKIKDELQNAMNITMERAMAASNQNVHIDATGYTGTKIVNGTISPEQLKIINNAIVFTDDNWQSCKTAVGKITVPGSLPGTETQVYGIAADAIFGKMILSDKIKVENVTSSILLDNHGVQVSENISSSGGGSFLPALLDRLKSMFSGLVEWLSGVMNINDIDYDAIGVKVYNASKKHRSALLSDMIVFKDENTHTSNHNPEDDYAFFGLRGAKTDALEVNSILAGGDTLPICADKIDSDALQYMPGDIMTVGEIDASVYDPLYAEYKKVIKDARKDYADLGTTAYGNIDMNDRQILEWNSENIDEYETALDSYGFDTPSKREALEGTVWTVYPWLFYNSDNSIFITYSPILQRDTGNETGTGIATETGSGPVLLSTETVESYIAALIGRLGENWDKNDLLSADATGATVGDIEIKNLIADEGDTFLRTALGMSYAGNFGKVRMAANDLLENTSSASYWADNGSGRPLQGYIKTTANGYEIHVDMQTEKSLEYVSEFHIRNLVFSIYGVGGMIMKSLNGNASVKTRFDVSESGNTIEVSFNKVGNYDLEMIIEDTGTFTNVVNGTPVSVFCELMQAEVI